MTSFKGWVIGALAVVTAVAGRSDASPSLSLLTYNVKGLPWPVASGRPAALAAIASELSALRKSGRQPHVVALQEAFVPEAKAIGRSAGYHYQAFGPAENDAVGPMIAADRAFMAKGSYWLGEQEGKHEDSGLAIFSDYPILAVRRIVYPVCAGYDCLANKGAVAVLIAVPGMRAPLVLIDTHLNSNAASRASAVRANYAYGRQVETLAAFVSEMIRSGNPVLLAGDFNVGHTPTRNAYFKERLLAPALGLGAVQTQCAGGGDCALDNRQDVLFSEHRARDWLMFRSGPNDHFLPVRLAAPFGKQPDGSMLSDHVGIQVTYDVTTVDQRRAPGIRIAMR